MRAISRRRAPTSRISDLQQRWSQPGTVWITQGFIASDEQGRHRPAGTRRLGYLGSYFAAKLQARRLEIWTDVPGMFSANPRSVPTARLLRALEYDEAQEIASSGAKVLHPRCIMPVKQYGIPLYVYATQTPKLEGTVITTQGGHVAAQVKAVTIKKNITLISMETVGMWHSVGFLADAFAVFKDHGMSVDLVSTSETSVTVSLDPAANTLDKAALDALVLDLGRLCRVEVIGPCAAVSLVGRNIRAILHRLGDALELFEEQKIYLVTQAANDLNITFVIDEEQGDRLVSRLHEIAIRKMTADRVLGPTWEELYGRPDKDSDASTQWWTERRNELLDARPRARRGVRLRPRDAEGEGAGAHVAAGHRQRLLCAQGELASGDSASCSMSRDSGSNASRGRSRARAARRCPRSIARRFCSRRTSRRATSTNGALQQGVWVTLDNLHPLQGVARAVQGPRALRAHRHRLRARPSRQGAHGRRAFEVRRTAVRDG